MLRYSQASASLNFRCQILRGVPLRMTDFQARSFVIACLFVGMYVTALASAQTTAPAGGLESLSDDRLISELATRGLTNLLDRAFEVNQVPPAQRDGMRTLIALRQSSDGKLTAAQ